MDEERKRLRNKIPIYSSDDKRCAYRNLSEMGELFSCSREVCLTFLVALMSSWLPLLRRCVRNK